MIDQRIWLPYKVNGSGMYGDKFTVCIPHSIQFQQDAGLWLLPLGCFRLVPQQLVLVEVSSDKSELTLPTSVGAGPGTVGRQPGAAPPT